MNKSTLYLSCIAITALLSACAETTSTDNDEAPSSPAAALPGIIETDNPLTQQLTDIEFNTLDDIDQYRVANKLYATVYKGILSLIHI